MAEPPPLVIIGAGPAGLAAAARAARVGMPHLLLEAGAEIADTQRRYPKGKLVMAEPAALPLRSSIGFAADTREAVLQRWREELAASGATLRTGAKVSQVSGQLGDFRVALAGGETLPAERVVVAIGRQGAIRRLDVPGDDLPGVRYQLDDPAEFAGETIVVVGGGDSAVENALALAPHNRVVLVNPHDEFINCGDANLRRLREALSVEGLEALTRSRVTAVEQAAGGGLTVVLSSAQGELRLACRRVIARIGNLPARRTLEMLGIHLPGAPSGTLPRLSAHFESEIPGLYIIGALAGNPLIKQALNQGYEVIEHIRGAPVAPADEDLLWRKLAAIPGVDSVTAAVERLRARQPMFESLNHLQLRDLLRDSEIRLPSPGEVLFRRNDFGNSFFSIMDGEVDIHVEYADGNRTRVPLSAGGCFGELGLLSGRRRSGTAIAGSGCVLVETPQRAMLKLLDGAPEVQRRVDAVALRRALANCFGTALPEAQIDLLVDGARECRYAAGELLFREGDAADGLYLIRRGSVTISRQVDGRDVVVAYVAAGNYVGEMALVSGQARSATVRAAAPTEAVLLAASHFHAVMANNPDARRDIARRYLEALRSASAGADSRNGKLVEFLVARGGGEATDMMLIDQQRCIRCDNCERACAAVHDGTSRLDRRAGQTFGNIHVPTSCRHCEHPHCMKDCPPDAIRRSPQGEIFIADSCIGCGNCQSHCPYGVIQLAVPGRHRRASVFDIILGRTPALEPTGGGMKAVKCDMCRGIVGEAACVRECPTGAARRVTPEEFHALAGDER